MTSSIKKINKVQPIIFKIKGQTNSISLLVVYNQVLIFWQRLKFSLRNEKEKVTFDSSNYIFYQCRAGAYGFSSPPISIFSLSW